MFNIIRSLYNINDKQLQLLLLLLLLFLLKLLKLFNMTISYENGNPDNLCWGVTNESIT